MSSNTKSHRKPQQRSGSQGSAQHPQSGQQRQPDSHQQTQTGGAGDKTPNQSQQQGEQSR